MTLGGGEVLHLSLILQDDVTSVSLTEKKNGVVVTSLLYRFMIFSLYQLQKSSELQRNFTALDGG